MSNASLAVRRGREAGSRRLFQTFPIASSADHAMHAIAHVSRKRSLWLGVQAVFILAVIIPGLVWISTGIAGGALDPILVVPLLLIVALIADGVAELLLLVLALSSRTGSVLWVQDGRLVHLSPLRARLRIADIDSVSIQQKRRGFGLISYLIVKSGNKTLHVRLNTCAESERDVLNSLLTLRR